MKHLKFLFLFIGLAILASCSDTDVNGGLIADENQANFSGKIGELQTRVTDNSWENGDAIGIYALNAGAELSEVAIFDGKSNVKYTTDAEGNFTAAAAPINFPNDGDLDFVAYYPYTSPITDYKYSIDVTSQSDLAAIDLLYSDNAKQHNKANPNVDLVFNHMLSKLVLNVELGENLTSLQGLTAGINNVVVDGNLALVDGTVTTGTTRKDITPNVAIASDNKTATVAAIVVPGQNLEDVTIVFSLGGKDYKWTPTTQELESTYKYSYIIKLTLDESGEPIVVPVKVGATINDWNDPQIGDTPIVLDPEKEGEDPVAGDKIDIVDFRAAVANGELYTEDKYIEGEVILNPANQVVNNAVAAISDGTAGITLFFGWDDDVVAAMPLGAKVKVGVKDGKWNVYNGLVQFEVNVTAVEIIEEAATTPLEPKVITIQDVLDGKYQSDLVQINDVQFKEVPATYNGNNALVNESNDEVNVYIRKEATFANENVPAGNGPFIGVVNHFNNPQLAVRKVDDLAGMTGPRIEPSFITVDPVTLTFEKAGGTETVSVTANVAWTASSDADWLTIDPASGTNNGTITVTATENGVDARNTTITITDGTITKTVSVTQKGEEPNGGGFATDLFFSEYIEGGGHNKFLEIYNGTGETVDLTGYSVTHYSNGDPIGDGSGSGTIELTGNLEHGKVLVIYNSQASIDPGTTNVIIDDKVANFNGDDAIALSKNGEFVDIIGRIGERVKWDAGGDLKTENRTLIRKPSVKDGVTVNPSEGFPTLATEWIGYPQDYHELGSHTTDY